VRKPRAPQTPIDSKRLRKWVREFAGYRQAVTQASIEDWLEQFESDDKDLAARILDAVDYYGADRIAAGFRTGLASLPGWDANPKKRTGRWRFVAFSGSTGQSGEAMVHQFRLANSLDGKVDDEMFIHRSEIVGEKLTAEDTVVMLDDLTATGTQVCEVWKVHFAELVAGVGHVYLMVVAAGKGARKLIKQETDLRLVPAREFDDRDRLFEDDCAHFTAAEKACLLKYAKVADHKQPKGFGECGYLLVFQHRCPNNSVPILHESHKSWEGLFPRHD